MLATIFFYTACDNEDLSEIFLPTGTHSEYQEAIRGLHLDRKELGRQWLAAAGSVFGEAAAIAIPFREERFFDAAIPAAFALEFTVPRGLKVKISIDSQFTAYFLDIFRIEIKNAQKEYTHVATKPQDLAALEFTPRFQGYYLVRIQPELLEEGRMLVTITGHASLAWPVKDSTEKDIISTFGVNRDGGGRVHHGLDIKAPRGQLALAAVSATGRPGQTERGGNVVRLFNNALDVMLYYAHLDTQLITGSTPVKPGDPVGTIGDTGNARGGTPHLHIGVYDGSWRTPVDGWYFFIEPDNYLEPLASLSLQAGAWGRVIKETALLKSPAGRSGLRRSPARKDGSGAALNPAFTASFNVKQEIQPGGLITAGTPVKLLGSRNGYAYLESPGGRRGYLSLADIGKYQPRERILDQAVNLYRDIRQPIMTVAELAPGSGIEELDHYTDWTLIMYQNRVYWTDRLDDY